MRVKLLSLCLMGLAFGFVACSQSSEQSAPAPTTAAAPAKPALNIKPNGTADPNFKPDYSKVPAELARVYEHIDANIDEHVEKYQSYVRQPSISNSGEGIPETAEMVKGF